MKLPSSSATDLNKANLEHMVSMKDFSVKEMDDMMELMTYLKEARKDNAVPQLFKGKSVGMIFEAGSTRTRVSFEVAATLLGGHALFLSPKDIHLGGKESIDDTSRVLSRMCDVIMARTNSPETLDGLLEMSTVPVINGLDTRFHPTQMLADLYTIKEHITDGRTLSDLTLAFMGDATDVCRSLMLTCAKYGMGFKQIGPKKYQMEQEWIDMAQSFCEESGGHIEITDDVERISDCDVVYGDSFYWVTQMDEKEERLAAFMPDYVISEELMAKAKPGAMLLHCLPANDKEEVTRGALESEYSVAFDEAENRLTAQMAILVYFTHKSIKEPTEEKLAMHKEKIEGFLAKL
ncbi:putrescine carbamoyltransferase [Vibrio sp. MACH09]|uniref:ornithine carbamoyltransferase n=1 Tax=unclassified Vibrio TaxID=2614977 RepID=UPI00149364AA|nr:MULTISPECIES: ornithine carbamoyltransferase [unclassified Vibrio]NOI67462.1 ornithine carbamoyltransferase [Vibrio sp. 99-8-1]GLO60774.1 putrescine carbamoyltransferase [Vibrio sp. MACH09]